MKIENDCIKHESSGWTDYTKGNKLKREGNIGWVVKCIKHKGNINIWRDVVDKQWHSKLQQWNMALLASVSLYVGSYTCQHYTQLICFYFCAGELVRGEYMSIDAWHIDVLQSYRPYEQVLTRPTFSMIRVQITAYTDVANLYDGQ